VSRLRVLILAPDADPERVSIPFVTYCHAAALAKLHDVSLVIGSPVEASIRRANAPFHSLEVIRMPWLEKIYDWALKKIFKYNYDTQVLTAFGYPFSIAFEWRAWRQLRKRIVAGEWDVVLRVLPMTPSLPSPFSSFLKNGTIPFVLGPLNGGLPWPAGFRQLEKQKEWISDLRNIYQYLPFARSTYRHATGIIAASSQVCAEFDQYSDKVFFVPEPGMAESQCEADARRPQPDAKLDFIFVGGLVPRKACNLALRAAASLLRNDQARFTVVGDGPERRELEQLAASLGIEKQVTFCGWVSHKEVLQRLRAADVLVFPSLRDNGAGIVFEALATGAVPVVADFGGPGDIVHSDVGYKVALTNENDIVEQIERVLNEVANNRERLLQLRRNGMSYVRDCLTWDAKARTVTRVLNWAVQRDAKPDLPAPKRLKSPSNSSREGTTSNPQPQTEFSSENQSQGVGTRP
jgi:glycosyltransferase involved in cell wall biosynthesis